MLYAVLVHHILAEGVQNNRQALLPRAGVPPEVIPARSVAPNQTLVPGCRYWPCSRVLPSYWMANLGQRCRQPRHMMQRSFTQTGRPSLISMDLVGALPCAEPTAYAGVVQREVGRLTHLLVLGKGNSQCEVGHGAPCEVAVLTPLNPPDDLGDLLVGLAVGLGDLVRV